MSENETTENKRKRLIFRSEHRGTKEMDLIMGSFARKHVHHFSESELEQYEDVLLNNDPDLYNWLTDKDEPPANVRNDVFEMLMKHKLL